MKSEVLTPHGASRMATRDENESKGRPYIHQAWPSTRFHPDGRSVTVADAQAAKALGEPWRDRPYPPVPVVAPAPEPTVADLRASIEELLVTLNSREKTITDLKTELALKTREKAPKEAKALDGPKSQEKTTKEPKAPKTPKAEEAAKPQESDNAQEKTPENPVAAE